MLVEKWQPPASLSVPVSSSHFSLVHLPLSRFPHLILFQSVPLLTLSLLLYLFFSIFPSSPICIPSLPPFPTPYIHTYSSAVMACVQRTQLAKPKASAERNESYRHSFTGCVCLCACTGSMFCVAYGFNCDSCN